MGVKQVSVFLENKSGQLADVCAVLSENGMSLRALSIADTKEYGILRVIVPDAEGALEVLRRAGYTCKLTQVLAVEIDDRPGGMAYVLQVLSEAGISVDYAYAFISHKAGYAHMILRVSDIDETIKALTEADIRTLEMDSLLTE